MPRFVCYCPDYPNSLERRLSVRAQHLVAAKADLAKGENEMGRQIMGSPFLPRPGTAQRDSPPPAGTPNLAGSFMIYQFETREECVARLQADVYWTAGVWDKERMEVEELA